MDAPSTAPRHAPRPALVAAGALLALAAAGALAEDGRWVERAALEDGRVVVVAEGELEPRESGSFTVRLHGQGDAGAPGRFVAAITRPREGRIVRMAWHDFDRDGRAELVVVMGYGDEAAGPLSADAFSFGRSRIARRASVDGLAADADPVRALAPRVKRATAP